MIESFLRLLKRFAVFLPGLAVSYWVVQDLYPIINRRLPAALAILVTYVITAYGLIPAVIRGIQFIHKPKHVPFYSTTPDGFASDPVNIAVLGTREALVKAFAMMGWHVADRQTPLTLLHLGLSMVLKLPYPNAPFSNLYLLGRSQDVGFQLAVDDNPKHRHHVRFWTVKPETAEHFKEHLAFWQAHHPDKNLLNDKFLWLGAASLDTGLGVIRHNAQLTHTIHHDTNAERELIVSELKKTGLVKKTRTIKIAKPYQLRNRVITGYLQSDGHLTIIEL